MSKLQHGDLWNMAIGRRRFFGLVVKAIALAAAPMLRLMPARYTMAIRARLYPGALRRLNEADVLRPGKWAG